MNNMKKILLVAFILLSYVSYGQQVTGQKTRFPGVFYSSKDTLYSTSADSIAVIYNHADSSLRFRRNSYWDRFIFKTDTAQMLLPYYNITASNARFNLKLNISDTANQWVGRGWLNSLVKYVDTSLMFSAYYNQTAVNSRLALKQNIGDTASMLTPYHGAYYASIFDTSTRVLTLIPIVGTPTTILIPRGSASGATGISVLSSSRTGNLAKISGDNGSFTYVSVNDADSSTRVHFSDTTGLVANYYNKTAVDSKLNLKLDKSDSTIANRVTANRVYIDASLVGKMNTSDSAAMLSHYPNYTATNAMLNLKLDKSDSTIASRVTSDRLFANASLASKMGYSDTVTLSNRINGKINISDSAAMLSPYWKASFASSKLSISDSAAMLGNYFNRTATNSLLATKMGFSDSVAMLSGYKTFYPRQAISAGTGISYSNTTGVVTNSSPDQTVVLNSGTGIAVSGTYPSFTITNTTTAIGTVTSVATNNGSGITGGTFTNSGTIAADTSILSTKANVGASLIGYATNASLSGKLDKSDSIIANRVTANRIYIDALGNTKVNLTDSTLANRITSDRNFINASLVLKLDKSDSTLANRITNDRLFTNSSLALKYNISDTASKWIGLGWINSFMKYVDTANAFSHYYNKTYIDSRYGNVINTDTSYTGTNYYNKTYINSRYGNVVNTDTSFVGTNYFNKTYVTANLALYTPLTRSLTINGTAQDLTTNRTWSVGTVTSVATNTGSGITGGTITGTGTIAADTTILSTKANVTAGISDKLSKGGGTMSGALILNADPTVALGAATKSYVDNAITGIYWKTAVKAATTANITLSGTQTIDGIALSVGDRVLVKNQTTATNNGLYTVAAGAWTRTTDANTGTLLWASAVYTTSGGTLNGGTQWTNSNSTLPVLGTDNITFSQIAGAGVYTNGTGIDLTGNVFSVNATSYSNWNTAYTNRITSATSPLSIAANAISMSQANTTTNGWLSSTDWNTFNNKQPAGSYLTAIGVTTANGVSGTSSGGTTPNLTISLGAITPSSVNSVVISGSATPTLAVTGTSSISGSNTGDNAANTTYASDYRAANFIAGTNYEVPLTFSTGLTRTTNIITVNASQNITTLSNLTTAGFVKTSAAGVLSVDASTYLTTISGIAAGGDLSGTYASPTVLNSAVIGKVLTGYVSGAGTVAATDNILQAIQKLNGNITAISGGYVTSITGTANQITASASTGAVTLSLPATITGLTSVTSTTFIGALTGTINTAAQPNITSVGTLTGGTWNASTIGVAYGGTGQTTLGGVQSWLGLGSNAYTSTAYLPLSGGTVTGASQINVSGLALLSIANGGASANYFRAANQYFQTVAGAELFYIHSNGVSVGSTNTTRGKVDIYGAAIGDIPLYITHAWGGSSTALISANNSGGEVFKVDRNGLLTATSGTFSGAVSLGTLESIMPYAKTNTSLNQIAVFRSNEAYASSPSQLSVFMIGAASQTNRTTVFQTGEYGVTNAGNISLQLYGGSVGIGLQNPTKTLDISGTLGVSGATTVGGEFKVTGTYAGSQGSIAIAGGSGMYIQGKTGTTYDLTLANASGAAALQIFAGTTNLYALGTFTVASTTTLGGALTGTSASFSSTGTFTGQLNANGGLAVTGLSTFSSNATFNGNITANADNYLANNVFWWGRNVANSAWYKIIGIDGSNKVAIDQSGVGTVFGSTINSGAITSTGAITTSLGTNSTTTSTGSIIVSGGGGIGVSGTIFANSVSAVTIYQTSDKFKKNIVATTSQNDGIDIISYKWKPEFKLDGKLHLGVIAQSVEKILPDAVQTDGEGYKTVNYTEVLLYKIQQLEIRVKQLENKNK